jgi:hypothetical protein
MKFFVPGDRVSQAQYGHGTVTRADEYHTSIDFDDHGPRTFSTSPDSRHHQRFPLEDGVHRPDPEERGKDPEILATSLCTRSRRS